VWFNAQVCRHSLSVPVDQRFPGAITSITYFSSVGVFVGMQFYLDGDKKLEPDFRRLPEPGIQLSSF
jgi:hypothetical protein